MTACLLMLSSFAVASSSLSMMAVRSTLTRANGRHYFSGIGEKTRDIFSTIGEARNGIGGNGPWFFTSALHRVSFPDAWIPKRDQVVVFACGIVAHFENQGVHSARPPTRACPVKVRNVG